VLWEPSLGEKVGNIVPTWVPRWRPNSFKNREKSDAKIDQKIDAFEDRFLMRSGRILGGKWSQVGTKIKEKSMLTLKGHFLEKTLFFPRKFNDFEGSRGCKIDGKSVKNNLKIEGPDGMPLDIDF